MVFNIYKNYGMFKKNRNIEKIPSLFVAFLLNKSSIKKEVVKDLTNYIKDFSSKDYINLSKEFRKRILFDLDISWQAVEVDSLLEDYMTEDEKIMILGLASMHPSGFVREKALIELEKYDEGKVLNFVAIRACDWIGAVRERAQKLLIEIINIKNIDSIIKNIMLIERIEKNINGLINHYRYAYGSMDMSSKIQKEKSFYKLMITKVRNVVSSEENKEKLRSLVLENFNFKDDYIKEYLLKEVIKNSLLSSKEVIQVLETVKNPVICTRCMKLILEGLSDEEVIKLKSDLDGIKGSRAKDELITRLYEAGYFENIKQLEVYALSKYALVRETSRFYMKKLGFEGFTNFYVEKLKDSIYGKSALLGLCEVCGQNEVEIILSYFEDSQTKAQKKILNKVMELSEGKLCCDYSIFFQGFKSGKRSIIKLCEVYLMQNSEFLDKEMLYDLYRSEKDEFAKEVLVKILCSGSGWIGLFYSITLLDDECQRGSIVAKKCLENWIHQKESYFVKDEETGKIKHYNLYKMNETMSLNMKNAMKRNSTFLEEKNRDIIKGLILNYS